MSEIETRLFPFRATQDNLIVQVTIHLREDPNGQPIFLIENSFEKCV